MLVKVLEEDSEEFAIKMWKFIVFELLKIEKGLTSWDYIIHKIKYQFLSSFYSSSSSYLNDSFIASYSRSSKS